MILKARGEVNRSRARPSPTHRVLRFKYTTSFQHVSHMGPKALEEPTRSTTTNYQLKGLPMFEYTTSSIPHCGSQSTWRVQQIKNHIIIDTWDNWDLKTRPQQTKKRTHSIELDDTKKISRFRFIKWILLRFEYIKTKENTLSGFRISNKPYLRLATPKQWQTLSRD